MIDDADDVEAIGDDAGVGKLIFAFEFGEVRRQRGL